MTSLWSGIIEDAWYPIGSPVDIRRHGVAHTMLMGRRVDLEIHRTWISPSVEGRALPVTERLGLVWTTLGRPNGPPQQLIEYYEVDRTTINVSSAPIGRDGSTIVEEAIRVLDKTNRRTDGASPTGGESSSNDPIRIDRDEYGSLVLRSPRAELGVLGSGLRCDVSVVSPLSAIFAFRYPSRPSGQEHRADFFAMFCQPLGGGSTVAHRLAAIVDLPGDEYERIRTEHPLASLDGEEQGESNVGEAVLAYRAWIDGITASALG